MAMSAVLEENKKCILVTLSGGFSSSEKTKEVMERYDKYISSIVPSKYSLLIDCSDMGVFEQNALVYLKKLFIMYMKSGFKHIVFVYPKNPIQSMQLKKVANDVPGFNGIFVDTLGEAYLECRR